MLDLFGTVSIFATDLAIDSRGDIYIANFDRVVYRLAGRDGALSVVAGTGQFGFSGDGGAATEAQLSFVGGIVLDADGNLYISEWEIFAPGRVRRVDATTGIITTLVDTGLNSPGGMALDSDGTIYIVDTVRAQVLAADPQTGSLSLVAGSGEDGFAGDGGPAILAALSFPQGVGIDGSGNLYIADTMSNRIRKVEAGSGTISTVVGNELEGLSGDGGPAGAALLSYPADLAFNGAGDLYISERDKHRIRKVDPTGIITTVVGNGSRGFSGDGGPAAQALLDGPAGIAIDTAGNLYVSDSNNNRIRRVDAVSRVITSVAGGSFERPPVVATRAELPFPPDVTVDSHGNFFVADDLFNAVYRVDAITGILSIFAGTPGATGFSGDGGPAIAAQLDGPVSLALDADGNLYIADRDNHRIRRVEAGTGIITTVAGNGEPRRSGDGGPAIDAGLFAAVGIVVDSCNRLFIGGFSVRQVDLSTGIISAVTGRGFSSSGDGGPALSASVGFISSLAFDANGNFYITDVWDNRVRAVRGPLP